MVLTTEQRTELLKAIKEMMDANQKEMKEGNNEKFEALRDTLVSRMDAHEGRMMKLRWPDNKTTHPQPNTQESRIKNYKNTTPKTRGRCGPQHCRRSSKPCIDTPEDGQLGRNM
jgi:hypothetical protein